MTARTPLGPRYYVVRISRDEVTLAYNHRKATGEPIQSYVRRLIRDAADTPAQAQRATASTQ